MQSRVLPLKPREVTVVMVIAAGTSACHSPDPLQSSQASQNHVPLYGCHQHDQQPLIVINPQAY